MQKNEFMAQMLEKSTKSNIMLPEEQIEKFYKYMNLLIEWNEKMNLTAIVEPSEIIEKHFIDSLLVLPYIDKNKKIIDVGTGAGFPGIPLKIVDESAEITLLDSLQKRIKFLEEIIQNLNLNKIEAVHSRAEEYAIKHREQYDIAISRAVANMSTLVEYLLPYVKVNGVAICMKGPNIEEELEKSKKAIKVLGGQIEKVEYFALGEDMQRNIIIIKKIKETPKAYPRKAGKPSKEPIQ